MFLKRLKLHNIRSISDLDLDFTAGEAHRKWTWLLGENGSGKSSVLKAIGLVMAGGDALLELVGDPDDWIRLDEEIARIEVEYAPLTGEARRAELVFRRGQSLFEFAQSNRALTQQLDAAIDKADRNYFVVAYGITRRPSGEGAAAGSRYRSRRARALATLFDSGASLVSLEQWAIDLEYRRGEAGLRAVNTALNNLLPDVAFAGIDRRGRRLMFHTRDGDLPLSALSDGYQAMAAWCGDLLWQITATFEDHKDPLKARGLLLVDELDLHLHPIWQRRLVSFLRITLPNMQIVATTHSPLTVHQAGAGELFVLRREENAVVARAYDGAPNRLMLHQLLQSPLFGLQTLDSPQVEILRNELRALQRAEDGGRAGRRDRSRMAAIRRELAEVPNWRETQPYLQRTNEVLEKLAAVLESGGGGQGDPVKRLGRRAAPRTPRG